MIAQEIKKHIYNLEPTAVKEIHSYCSDLIRERTHAIVNTKNKNLILDYRKMIGYIEDKLFIKIISQSRKQKYTFARYCLYKFIQNELMETMAVQRTNSSFVSLIGNIFEKNHATIVIGLQTYNNEIAVNTDMQEVDTKIKKIIESYKEMMFSETIEKIIR